MSLRLNPSTQRERERTEIRDATAFGPNIETNLAKLYNLVHRVRRELSDRGVLKSRISSRFTPGKSSSQNENRILAGSAFYVDGDFRVVQIPENEPLVENFLRCCSSLLVPGRHKCCDDPHCLIDGRLKRDVHPVHCVGNTTRLVEVATRNVHDVLTHMGPYVEVDVGFLRCAVTC